MNIHGLYDLLFRIWRPRRIMHMRDTMEIAEGQTLLDVGGTISFWKKAPIKMRVDVLNTHPQNEYDDHCRYFEGDARRIRFGNGSYDLVFSNSVIEHVGTLADQKAMAEEIRRVGRSYWVQTPAAEFLIEPHYIGVGIHWLPKTWRQFAVRWLSVRGLMSNAANKSEIDELVATTRLLTKRELQALFPDATIYVERFLLMPKSYVAYRKESLPSTN